MTFDTKRGQILGAILTRVRSMTVAGGYHFDVKAESVTSDPINVLTVPDPSLPFFLVEISPSSREFQPANRIKIKTRLLITFRAMANGTDPTRKTMLGENLYGDLEKAIGADITLGGLVIDTRLQEPDGPMVGMGANNNVFGLAELETTHIREYGIP